MYLQAIVKFSGKYYNRVSDTGYNYKDSLYFRTGIYRTKEEDIHEKAGYLSTSPMSKIQ